MSDWPRSYKPNIFEGAAALSFAGILTAAFMSPLLTQGRIAVCCFGASLPLLIAYRISRWEFGSEVIFVRPDVEFLAMAAGPLCSVIGFALLLWHIEPIASVVFAVMAIFMSYRLVRAWQYVTWKRQQGYEYLLNVRKDIEAKGDLGGDSVHP